MEGYKKSILLIIFFTFAVSCKFSGDLEIEPNNTFSNANKIELNKEITGYLDSENDTDNYILDITDEQIVRIDLSGIKGVNHAINIYKNENAKPLLIKVIDDNRKSASETFANLYVQRGQYYITVTHGSRDIKKGNTETPYKLKVTSRSYLNEEKEPNDTPATATLIEDKSIIKGYYSPAQNSLNNDEKSKMKEIDWYKFDITLSDNLPSLIDIQLSGTSGIDSCITVLNSALEEIYNSDSKGTGEGETVSDLGIKESGVYYIQVYSKNFLSNHETPYELKLDIKKYDQNSELEPNNSFEKANLIMNNIVHGRLNGLDDHDFYQFIPEIKNKYYKIICRGDGGTDSILTIYDMNRNKLFEINNTGAGEAERLPYFIVKNSVYISVSTAIVPGIDSSYTLELEKFDSNDNLEIEPNNSKSTANAIHKTITGFINSKNDIDYFFVKNDDKQKVKITVKGIKDGKIKISTTDPLGFIIKSKVVNSDEEISFDEIFDRKGFIIIEPVIANFEYPYTITLEDF